MSAYAPQNSLVPIVQINDKFHLGVYEVAGLSIFVALVEKKGEKWVSSRLSECTERAVKGHGGYDKYREHLVKKYKKALEQINTPNEELDAHLKALAGVLSSISPDELQ